MIIIFPSKKEKILNLISTKIKDRVEPILIGHSEYIKQKNFFFNFGFTDNQNMYGINKSVKGSCCISKRNSHKESKYM